MGAAGNNLRGVKAELAAHALEISRARRELRKDIPVERREDDGGIWHGSR